MENISKNLLQFFFYNLEILFDAFLIQILLPFKRTKYNQILISGLKNIN